MGTAWLGLGSNQDAESNIRSAIGVLRKTFDEVELSPVYTSKAVGFEGDDFINLVARIETAMTPLELRQFLRELEDRHGRKRDVPKFSDRSLDIDILLYDDLVVFSPLLEIPRAEILTFAHVLKPLAELDPELVHPMERRGLADLWRSSRLDDAYLVRLAEFKY